MSERKIRPCDSTRGCDAEYGHTTVASGGSIDRRKLCHDCGKPLLYRIDTPEWAMAREPVVISIFCGNIDCRAAFKESAP